MAEGVRRNPLGQSGPGRRSLEHPGGPLTSQPAASLVEEECSTGPRGGQSRPGACQVALQGSHGISPEWNDPFLASLPHHADAALVQVHLVDIQADYLGDAKAGSV